MVAVVVRMQSSEAGFVALEHMQSFEPELVVTQHMQSFEPELVECVFESDKQLVDTLSVR